MLARKKPRHDGNDVTCPHCRMAFWLDPSAAACECPHCGRDLVVTRPARQSGPGQPEEKGGAV